jgi:hypothetical protein
MDLADVIAEASKSVGSREYVVNARKKMNYSFCLTENIAAY